MASVRACHAIETFKCAAGCGADVRVNVLKKGSKITVPVKEQPYMTCKECREKAAN